MTDEMGSWRSIASSASRSIRSYVAQRDWKRMPGADLSAAQPTDEAQRPSLRQWAGQTLRAISQPSTTSVYVEKLALFPGWAHRKYHKQLIDTAASGVYYLCLPVLYLCLLFRPCTVRRRTSRLGIRVSS
jgi:hypothetical protein